MHLVGQVGWHTGIVRVMGYTLHKSAASFEKRAVSVG